MYSVRNRLNARCCAAIGGAGWATGASFQGPVHAFMRAVLPRRRRVNALMLDAEPHPPHVELGETVDATRGEGDPVLRPHRARQAELPRGALEDGPGPVAFDVRPPLTGQQVPGVLIADGEREAPHAIARRELAL